MFTVAVVRPDKYDGLLNLSSFFLIPTVVSGVGHLPREILAETDPTPSKNTPTSTSLTVIVSNVVPVSPSWAVYSYTVI